MTKQIETVTALAATPAEVWQLLVDVERFGEWHPNTRFAAPLEVGKRVMMRIKVYGLPLYMPVRVLDMVPGEGLSWAGGLPGVFVGRHYFRLEANADGTGCSMVHGEEFRGLLVGLMWPLMLPTLKRFYGQINRAVEGQLLSKGGVV